MSLSISRNLYKNLTTANPVSPNIFCAAPCGIEYNGRLYVYGTNDNEQFVRENFYGKNSYEKIQSLVCFSTDDLINWTFHEEINVKEIAPWILNSWAPSVVYRKESDGLTHFYLYFSNNGCGIGVLTSTSPLGPWKDPVGKSLVSYDMENLKDCPTPFDPGICIDDKGDAYLVFGGGYAPFHDDSMPGTARIVKLESDLISLSSDFYEIPAPYFFEASDIKYINGKYIYFYNNNWVERSKWNYPVPSPSACSMSYMTTKTPLVPESWIYQKDFFKNPGEQGLNYSNNHTDLVKYRNKWYILYHTLTLQENTPYTGGYRSICIDEAFVDDRNGDFLILPTKGTRVGVQKIKNYNPFCINSGKTMFTCADIDFKNAFDGEKQAFSKENGAWLLVKNVDFDFCEDMQQKSVYSRLFSFEIEACCEKSSENQPQIFVVFDKLSNEPKAIFEVGEELEKKSIQLSENISGVHDIYFIFSSAGIYFYNWEVRL